MNRLFQLRTPRLLLRRWLADDYPCFAALNNDEEVMRYFPSCLDQAESDALADRIANGITERGWGLWATELRTNNEFLGFIGLSPNSDTPQGDIVEIGWRLKRESWGQGYATEGATAALLFAFEMLSLNQVYSFTSTTNLRSRAVMERLGMMNSNENFMHPKVAEESPLREHVLYRISKEQFHSELPVEFESVST